MNISAEFEREKGGRWVATIPGLRDLVGYGSTRHEAAVGLTVHALRMLADRVKSGQIEVEDEPVRILLPDAAEDRLAAILAGLLFGSETDHTPNAKTIAAFEEYERNGGESFEDFKDLIAKLNAD